MSESYFTELEDVLYSVVEYIPHIGTVYSIQRAAIANREHDWKRQWASLANFIESSIRDVIITTGTVELPEVVLLHTMAEAFTDKMIDIYHSRTKHIFKLKKQLNPEDGHVIISESEQGKHVHRLFGGEAKGLHHFHGATFSGVLKHSAYAPEGEKIRFQLLHGMHNGAKVTFSWRWTEDASGTKDRPEATMGFLRLTPGKPTRFGLTKRKGAGGWEGYDFWGSVISTRHIQAVTHVEGDEVSIDFWRDGET